MDIREFLKNITPEELERLNNEEIERAKKQYKEFRVAFDKGCCYLCGMKLDYFENSEECFHWFLMPSGIKKRDFENYLKKPPGLFQLESYLRWVANLESPFKNINDLASKDHNAKEIERTIKYKNIEWTFNAGKTDIEGHKYSKNANFPHFHLQIFVDNRPFIRFNDLHIPLSKHDLFMIDTLKNTDLIEHFNLFGEGISVLENEENLLWIEDKLESSTNPEDATFHTQSLFMLPDNKEITGEELGKIIEEARELKIPVRKYLRSKIPKVKIVSKIAPGLGVIDKKTRNKRN